MDFDEGEETLLHVAVLGHRVRKAETYICKG